MARRCTCTEFHRVAGQLCRSCRRQIEKEFILFTPFELAPSQNAKFELDPKPNAVTRTSIRSLQHSLTQELWTVQRQARA
jgi:hypothetical protein